MRLATAIAAIALAVTAAGCVDRTTAPHDTVPPAAPRGVFSITGDNQVELRWLANTESDVVGYRIYMAPCATGSGCPYDRVGSTSATSFNVSGLTNGVTRYYAVGAVDGAGNESALSYETVFDTPRPAGTGAILYNFVSSPSIAGWDISSVTVRPFDDPATDVFFGNNGSVSQMFAADTYTDIQDAGYGATLDAVTWAPASGWSPTGTVELIVGHCYVVWTRDDHYAKFRVTSVSSSAVHFDWAYQTATSNPELRAKRPREEGGPKSRQVAWIR